MTRVPSVMKHSFSVSPSANIPRSSFDRSHGYKTTFDAGYLIPFFRDEVLPGDTFNLKVTAFARLATPLFPYMDNLFLDTHFFFVPNRLIWDNWQKFNGEQNNPGDSTSFLVPNVTVPSGGYSVQTIFDYLGVPIQKDSFTFNATYLRAYNLIWNEWFRDENIQNSVAVPTGDGPDLSSNYTLLRRGKRYDYFTSALPWPQKGPAVSLPLIGNAPVVSDGSYPTFDSVTALNRRLQFNTNGTVGFQGSAPGSPEFVQKFVQTGLEADLTAVTAATVNQLRQAFQIQKLYERDARGGTRYTEIIRSHFGVQSPDARLQRPEYLGGGSTIVSVYPVPQTSSSDSESPQANLAAYGTANVNGHGFTKSFTEHGVIIGLVSVRSDLNYQQGLDRSLSRDTRWSYYWPALSHIGEQSILNKEIFLQGTSADDGVFGYQERFAEYRYKPSLVTGMFRSDYSQSLDAWHLAQDFANLPTLSPQFIVEDPPVDRIKALGDDYPDFLLDAYFNLRCVRPMPTYSVPGLIDHF